MKRILFWITLGVAVSLIIAGFCLPPLEIIDNSVLIAVGELGFFGVIAASVLSPFIEGWQQMLGEK
jgi:hypothetical protein